MTLIDLTRPPVYSSRLATLPVAIIGAGPIGLAAAANLVERGIDFVIYEAGDTIADSMRQWGHIRLFSPWKHLVDPASRRLLEATGWVHPDEDGLPTGADVIDASGTYRSPNSLASSGLEPLGLPEVADLVSHALPNVLGRGRVRFAGRHTTVVGAGHSAANTLLNLATLAESEPGTRITWAIRNASAVRVSTSPDDELEARASLGTRVDALVASGAIEVLDRFEIVRLSRQGDAVRMVGSRAGELVDHDTDRIVNATGFRPNLDMLREVRLELDDIVEAPKRTCTLAAPSSRTGSPNCSSPRTGSSSPA